MIDKKLPAIKPTRIGGGMFVKPPLLVPAVEPDDVGLIQSRVHSELREKCAQRLTRTSANFEAEVQMTLQLAQQMTARFHLMELAIREIQAAVLIQQCHRSYIARRALRRLKGIRLIISWLYCKIISRKRRKMRLRICISLWNYRIRCIKEDFVQRFRAGYRIKERLVIYLHSKKAHHRFVRMRFSRRTVERVLDVSTAQAVVHYENVRKHKDVVRKQLSAWLWPIYARWKRRKMLFTSPDRTKRYFFYLATKAAVVHKTTRKEEMRNETLDFIVRRFNDHRDRSRYIEFSSEVYGDGEFIAKGNLAYMVKLYNQYDRRFDAFLIDNNHSTTQVRSIYMSSVLQCNCCCKSDRAQLIQSLSKYIHACLTYLPYDELN